MTGARPLAGMQFNQKTWGPCGQQQNKVCLHQGPASPVSRTVPSSQSYNSVWLVSVIKVPDLTLSPNGNKY